MIRKISQNTPNFKRNKPVTAPFKSEIDALINTAGVFAENKFRPQKTEKEGLIRLVSEAGDTLEYQKPLKDVKESLKANQVLITKEKCEKAPLLKSLFQSTIDTIEENFSK